MLKNRYKEIHIGLNLVSLLRGIISLKRNNSTLLIDDNRFQSESYSQSFLSEMEVLAILRIGKNYEVPELKDVRQFLRPAKIEFIADDTRLWLGSSSPYKNLKEILRKYPEFLSKEELLSVFNENEEEFDRYFIEELKRFESLCFEFSTRPKGFHFDLNGPKWLKSMFDNFSKVINQEYTEIKTLSLKNLLHFLGIVSEDKLKSILAPEEIPYYFFRLISPVYRLQDFFLFTQLRRRHQLMGGDYKESNIQFWQFHQNKFENLLLASFEGVISGERVLFFSHLPEEAPFSLNSPYQFYRKTQMSTQKRKATPFPITEISFLTDSSFIGSDLPYRSYSGNSDTCIYQWPYPDCPGSKSEFYEKDLKMSFEKDAGRVPFEIKEATQSAVLSSTLDLRSNWERRKIEAPILSTLQMEITEEDSVIKGFEYWGSFKYRSFGLLALCYGVEGV